MSNILIGSFGKKSRSEPQVNADWNAVSGVAEILNKPTIPEGGVGVEHTSIGLVDAEILEFGDDFTTSWNDVNKRVTVGVKSSSQILLINEYVEDWFFAKGYSVVSTNLGGATIGITDSIDDSVYGIGQVNCSNGVNFAQRGFTLGTANAVSSGGANSIILRPNLKLRLEGKLRFFDLVNTNTIAIVLGLFSQVPISDAIAFTEPTDGAYFLVRSENFSGRIAAVTSKAGVQTLVDTGVVYTTTKYYKFVVEWDGTNCLFYIDGTLVATINTNIPIVGMYAGQFLGKKTTANTIVRIWSDYVKMKIERFI